MCLSMFGYFVLLWSIYSPLLAFGNTYVNFCGGSYGLQLFISDFISGDFTVSNEVQTGDCDSVGKVSFTDHWFGDFIGEEALVLTTGSMFTAADNANDASGTTTVHNTPGDADLTAIVGSDTFDASIVEFDISSAFDVDVSFNFIFASEEYTEYVGSQFNDVFAFFFDDSNVALIDDGSGNIAVAINNINNNNLAAFFIDNDGGSLATEWDGFTKVLTTIKFSMTKNEIHHIKLAIADTGDRSWDSAIYLQPGSFEPQPLIDFCDESPCQCDNSKPNFEDPYCKICHTVGCSQCIGTNGQYFKQSFNHPCTECQGVFGDGCMFCQDFLGCGQCKSGYNRVLNTNENLYICESIDNPDPNDGNCEIDLGKCPDDDIYCLDYNPNCAEWTNWGPCKTCMDGYWKDSNKHRCVSCDIVGQGCTSCGDYNGCKNCDAGYNLYWDTDCGIARFRQ